MAEKKPFSEAELDALLAAAADAPKSADPRLLARIIADADQIADQREKPMAGAAKAPRPGFLAGLFSGIGGWSAMAGLTTATLAGIWIGYASPDSLSGITQALISREIGYDLGDYMPAITDIFEEG